VQIQPQLVLLQKTLLNVEGLGRELDPQLDLWMTAKPYLERWMHERMGFTGFRNKITKEATQWAQLMPEFPRLIHQRLSQRDVSAEILHELKLNRKAREQGNKLLLALGFLIMTSLALAGWWYFSGQF